MRIKSRHEQYRRRRDRDDGDDGVLPVGVDRGDTRQPRSRPVGAACSGWWLVSIPILEPVVVQNAPGQNCTQQTKSLVGPIDLGVIQIAVGNAKTKIQGTASHPNTTAEVAEPQRHGAGRHHGRRCPLIRAQTNAGTCSGTFGTPNSRPTLTTAGFVGTVFINGSPVEIGTGPVTIPILGLATLTFNQVTKTLYNVKRSAIRLQVPSLGIDLVVAEAQVGLHRSPLRRRLGELAPHSYGRPAQPRLGGPFVVPGTRTKRLRPRPGRTLVTRPGVTVPAVSAAGETPVAAPPSPAARFAQLALVIPAVAFLLGAGRTPAPASRGSGPRHPRWRRWCSTISSRPCSTSWPGSVEGRLDAPTLERAATAAA